MHTSARCRPATQLSTLRYMYEYNMCMSPVRQMQVYICIHTHIYICISPVRQMQASDTAIDGAIHVQHGHVRVHVELTCTRTSRSHVRSTSSCARCNGHILMLVTFAVRTCVSTSAVHARACRPPLQLPMALRYLRPGTVTGEVACAIGLHIQRET